MYACSAYILYWLPEKFKAKAQILPIINWPHKCNPEQSRSLHLDLTNKNVSKKFDTEMVLWLNKVK